MNPSKYTYSEKREVIQHFEQNLYVYIRRKIGWKNANNILEMRLLRRERQ